MDFDWQGTWQTISGFIAAYGLKVIGAILIFIIGRIVIGIITRGIHKVMKRSNVDKTLSKFVISLVRIALLTLLVIIIINKLGADTTSFAAVIAAAGLAIGLALQGSLSNFAAGVMLMIFRPFKAGDYVEAGGSAGTVESVQIFVTVLITPDNKRVIVPNSQITGGNIINYSAHETRRVDMVFGIGYGDDIRKAKDILNRILSEDSRVLKDPAPTVVAVSELGDSSVNFVVRPWDKDIGLLGSLFRYSPESERDFRCRGYLDPVPAERHSYAPGERGLGAAIPMIV